MELAQLVQIVGHPLQVLQTSGLGDGNLSLLAAWNLQLQMAFERMANIKEYRCCLRLLPFCMLSAQHLKAQKTKQPRSLLHWQFLMPFFIQKKFAGQEVSMSCVDSAGPLRVSGHWHAAMSHFSFPSFLGHIMPICAMALAHLLL